MLGYYMPHYDDEEEDTPPTKKNTLKCPECEGHGMLLYCDCARGKRCGNYREEACCKCDGKGHL